VVIGCKQKKRYHAKLKNPSTGKGKEESKNKSNSVGKRRERRRARAKSLLALTLLGPTHATTTCTQSRRTRHNRAALLIPKNVDAEVLASFSVQELEHHILLLGRISLPDQLKHLHRRDRPIATLGLLVGFLVAFADESVVSNEISLDMSPMMRPRIVVTVLLSILLLTNRTPRFGLIRIKTTTTDVAREMILRRVTVLMPFAMLRPSKTLNALREEFASMLLLVGA
jgi:hypothetical protein